MRYLFHAFFVLAGLVSLFVLVQAGSDYLSTIASLQDFRWGIAGFAAPPAGASETNLTLEVRNDSRIDLDFTELEVYLWLNGATVGKTYGQLQTRTVSAHSTAHIPLTVQIDPTQLRDALAVQGAERNWSITGSYKAIAPFAPNDFVYHLQFDIR